jgi:peptide/nickel transport system substrate-binding protein
VDQQRSSPRLHAGWRRLGATLGATVLIAAACASTASPTPTATTGPTTAPTATPVPTPAPPLVLKVAATAAITTWDPIKSFSTEAFYMANLYEPLLRINPPGSADKFTGVLATSWDVSADGLTWTFHLRPNVTFHDGTPMNADAVIQSLQAAADHGGASFIWAPLKSIDPVDPMTVKITLKYAAAVDLIASSLYGAWIVSPKALAAVKADDKYFESGVDGGTGPYTIESYTADKEVLMKAYTGYWGGWSDVKHYDKVLVSITPEAVTQQQMLDGGQVDIAFNVPLQNVASYKTNPAFDVVQQPSFFNYVGLFNTEKAPFNNATVRQALSYAIPYADIITVGTSGYGTQSRGPVPAGVFPYSADVPQYSTDMAKAKSLLASTPYAAGFKMEITYASENANEAAFAPLIKDAFAQLNVDVTLTPMLFDQQWARGKGDAAKRQDMFLLLYWPTYSDAGSDNLWSLFHSGNPPFFNLSYWNNKQYDTLIDDAGTKTATARDAAQAEYVTAMKLLVDQAPGVFFYDTQAVFPFPKSIAGYQYNLNYPFAQFFYPLHPAQ